MPNGMSDKEWAAVRDAVRQACDRTRADYARYEEIWGTGALPAGSVQDALDYLRACEDKGVLKSNDGRRSFAPAP